MQIPQRCRCVCAGYLEPQWVLKSTQTLDLRHFTPKRSSNSSVWRESRPHAHPNSAQNTSSHALSPAPPAAACKEQRVWIRTDGRHVGVDLRIPQLCSCCFLLYFYRAHLSLGGGYVKSKQVSRPAGRKRWDQIFKIKPAVKHLQSPSL